MLALPYLAGALLTIWAGHLALDGSRSAVDRTLAAAALSSLLIYVLSPLAFRTLWGRRHAVLACSDRPPFRRRAVRHTGRLAGLDHRPPRRRDPTPYRHGSGSTGRTVGGGPFLGTRSVDKTNRRDRRVGLPKAHPKF